MYLQSIRAVGGFGRYPLQEIVWQTTDSYIDTFKSVIYLQVIPDIEQNVRNMGFGWN